MKMKHFKWPWLAIALGTMWATMHTGRHEIGYLPVTCALIAIFYQREA